MQRFTTLALSSVLASTAARSLDQLAQTQLKALQSEETTTSFMPNRQENLLPPYGNKWRGATSIEGNWMTGIDVELDFEDVWNVPLHIYRTFKAKSNAKIVNEVPWIERGGILFYSIQPAAYEGGNYAAYGPGSNGEPGAKDNLIKKYARAIAEVSPHKVMVPVGFEPDLYTIEGTAKFRGTPEEYKAMYANFVKVFEDEGVDNVVWVMDYSFEIRSHPDRAVELWPDNNVVGWLFFNLFQFKGLNSKDGKGDCPGGLHEIYGQLEARIDQVPEWEHIPWGLGAWGSNESDFAGREISQEDREHCINGVREKLESDDYKRLKASISFNSLGSSIDSRPDTEMSPNPMRSTFQGLLDSPAFHVDDSLLEWNNWRPCENKGGLCANSCDSRCSMSRSITDTTWAQAGLTACRCDPNGFEYDDIDYEDQFQGNCKGCVKKSQDTCQLRWTWDNPEKKRFRCSKHSFAY